MKFKRPNPTIGGLIYKDLKLMLLNASGWLTIAVFNLVVVWLFSQNFFLVGQSELTPLFSLVKWGFIILASALSMRAFADERAKQTIELLLSWPVSPWQIVMSKFIAGLTVYFSLVLSLLPVMVLVSFLGPVDAGQVVSFIIGSLALFSLYYAYSLFVSLYFKNIVASFLFSLFSLFVWYLSGTAFVSDRLPVQLSTLLASVSIDSYYQTFLIGVPSLAAVVFFTSFVFLFLRLSVIRLIKKDQVL